VARVQQTPNRVWSDGIHFVRPVAPHIERALRWFVGAHRTTASPFRHWYETVSEATEQAQRATKAWLTSHPDDRSHLKAPKQPAASSTQEAPKEPFVTTHFTCICANPYAQVWQCTSYAGEKAAVGRRKAGGRAPEQTPFRHTKGQCSVLIGLEPVREEDGRVRIFETWVEAEHFALELYAAAPEDEVILWHEGDKRVGATRRIDILFDPSMSESQPFLLWLRDHRRPVFMDMTRPLQYATSRAKSVDPLLNPQAYLDELERKANRSEEERVDSLRERPLLFRSIWMAEEEADRRERMLNGELVL
jgi:hypothetical protein